MGTHMIAALLEFTKTFGLDLLGYFLTTGVFALLVFKLKPQRLMARKIQPQREPTGKDIKREILASIRTGAVFGLAAILGYALFQAGVMRVYFDVADYGLLYLLFTIPLVIVAHDAWFYWTHRAMHHPKLFKHMHVTHHLSRVPTPFTAFSFDPLEALSHALFTTVFVSLVPVHPGVMAFHFVFMIIRNVMGHTGFELMPKWWLNSTWTRWINTTTHHDLHHQRGGYNLGLYFTWWDKWMGTEHPDYEARFHETWARSDALDLAADDDRQSKLAGRVVAGLIGLFVGVALLLTAAPSRAADDTSLEGRWISKARDIILDIGPCQAGSDEWCGTIVWVPTDTNGQPRLDRMNKDHALKSRPLIGIKMGWGFAPSGTNKFDGGRIYSPDDGNTYKSKARVVSATQAEMDGCVFIFCRTEHLDRYVPGMKLLDPATMTLVDNTYDTRETEADSDADADADGAKQLARSD